MPPTVLGPVNINGVKYRLVKNVADTPTPIVEKCTGADALGIEGWARLTPASEPADLWSALQAALTRL